MRGPASHWAVSPARYREHLYHQTKHCRVCSDVFCSMDISLMAKNMPCD